MKKKTIIPIFITVLTIIMMLIPQFTVVADESDTSTVKEPAGTPIFTLSTSQTFQAKAGENTNLSFYLDNVSTSTSRLTTILVLDEKNTISISSTDVIKDINIHPGYSMRAQFSIYVPQTVVAGRYPLLLKLTNVNEDNVTSEQTLTIYIDVNNKLSIKSLDIVDYSIDKDIVSNNDKFNITVSVKNNCGLDLQNAKITVDGLDGTKFAMDSGLPYKTIDIKKDEQITLVFPLIACKGIASIREVLPVKIAYMLDENNKDTLQENTFNITVPCKVSNAADPDNKSFAPTIIIDNYSFGGAYVVGGKSFPLALTIRNTSATSSIQNLKVTIQGVAGKDDGGVAFSPANSSNTFFYENFGVNASEKINIDLLPKVDAKPNSYPVQLTFDYEYTANGKKEKAETVTQTITIPLQQDDRFSVNSPEIETNSYIGQECPLSVTVVNKGKSAVYNVSVDVEGEGFDKTSSAYYIGNVESGKEELYDAKIIPNKEGEIKGTIVVTYEDSNGTQKEIREEFITTAGQMAADSGIGKDGINNIPVDANINGAKKSSAALLIGMGVGAVVIVAGVIVTIKIVKKKKQKAIEKEDEDEDI